jgi:hypothetical protein
MSLTFTEIQPAGDVDKNWQQVFINDTGLKIVAFEVLEDYSSVIHYSNDGGLTWDSIEKEQCQFFTVSGNGLVWIFYGVLYGQLQYSTDYGATWDMPSLADSNPEHMHTNLSFNDIATNYDGSIIYLNAYYTGS